MPQRPVLQMLRALSVATAFVLVSCADESLPDPNDLGTPVSAAVAPSQVDASRFLTQATFGPTAADIDLVTRFGYEQWIAAEYEKPSRSHLQRLRALDVQGEDIRDDDAHESFWRSAVYGRDQLRQRAAFALSQLLVISAEDGGVGGRPLTLASYMDVMLLNAFGNYRDLLHDVTYSPAMSIYLTYLQNRRTDEERGRVPDENYAREVMQLFTIGLLELDATGEPIPDGAGGFIETYDNDDVTELAKVFTGLSWNGEDFFDRDTRAPDHEYAPLKAFEREHSPEEKAFLGAVIPEGTGADESIAIALDTLFEHPNTAPFVSKQLIQRLVTSNPTPAYVGRVAAAFDAGVFTGPDGGTFGGGERGDLRAVWAAILLDPEARDAATAADPAFGKLREPVVRFAHWARNFVPEENTDETPSSLRDSNRPDRLAQQAFRSPSVFNFYRPGYVAPGTATGDRQLVAPELQITHETSVAGYIDFMSRFIQDRVGDGYEPDYTDEIAIAHDPAALVGHLDLIMTNGAMRTETRDRILAAVNEIDIGPESTEERDRSRRVQAALLMIVTSPEYLVQQ